MGAANVRRWGMGSPKPAEVSWRTAVKPVFCVSIKMTSPGGFPPGEAHWPKSGNETSVSTA